MLKQRVASALLLLIPVSLIFAVGGGALQLLGLAGHAVVNFELLSLALPLPMKWILPLSAILLLPPLGFLASGWEGFGGGMITSTLLLGSAAVVLVERLRHAVPLEHVLAGIALSISYTTTLGSVPIIVSTLPGGRELLIWLLATVIASDSGAYFIGRSFGRHPLAPRLSPRKTIEGAIGGAVAALTVALLAWHLLKLPLSGAAAGTLAALVALLAQIGDLFESSVKRLYGVKDMSTLIPGHGGLLDRIDAFLFASPVLLLTL